MRLRLTWPPVVTLLAVLTLGLALAAWINLPFGTQLVNRTVFSTALLLPPVAAFQHGERILLLSPHPDDETLCCAGLIQQAQAAGAEVFLAWITPGDGFELDGAFVAHQFDPTTTAMQGLARTRTQEAGRAADALGVPAGHRFVLGYPDGGLMHLFLEHYVTPFTSPFTGQAAVYLGGTVSPGAAYTGSNLERDIGQVLDLIQPDHVWIPAAEDQHADHQAVSYIATRVMAERRQVNRLRSWVVHGGLEWPLPKGFHPELPLTVPPRAQALHWHQLALTPAEQATKLRAIQNYATQTALLGRFMLAFDRKTEQLASMGDPGWTGEVQP